MSTPPEKKQKTTDEKAEEPMEVEEQAPAEEEKAEAEAPKVEEKKELEEDAKAVKDKIKDKVCFNLPDTTMNVLPSTNPNLLVSLSEGNLAMLSACARANVGVKSGRYMFEAKIIEQISGDKNWKQKHFFRIGFSTEGSLFLGEEENSVCFDLDGNFVHKKSRKRCGGAFGRDTTVGVVLNLDSSSPNFNTVSLFKSGVRASDPQPLPEALKGKTLFPAVSFRSTTVHVNFGPATEPLPFKCLAVEEASSKDVEVNKYSAPEDGKYTALFPVCLPDEGTFDWLDSFLEKNPDYVEFSDRALAEWGANSGHHATGQSGCKDKPRVGFEPKYIRETLMSILSMHPRNLVFMEVEGNLIKEERMAALAKFQSSGFKIVADVLVGETPQSFKKIVHSKLLHAKQALADAEAKTVYIKKKREWEVRKVEKMTAKKKRDMEKEALKRQKEKAEARKKVELENKKKAKEAAAKKAAEEGKEVEAEEEEKAEEEEEKKEEEAEAVSEEEPDEPEPVEEKAAAVELTAEDKATRFFKHTVPDLASYNLSTSMTKFSLPDKSEGFTTVKYSWSKEKDAAEYVKAWLLEKKLTTRVEDITPSQWFKDQSTKWTKDLAEWKKALNDFKAKVSKREADKAAKAQRKKVAEKKAQMEAAKKAEEAAAKAKADAEKKEEGGEKKEEEKEEEKKEEEKKEEPAAPMEVEEEAEEEDPADAVDFENIDIFGVTDVSDLGGKMPLLKDFLFEDFALMSLRVELHILANSFVKDVNDPDRTGVHVDHLAFYYQKYYGKQLSFNSFGVKTAEELVGLVNDTINIVPKTKVIQSVVPAELESYAVFVKLTEHARRHRSLMLDMGEPSAKLNIAHQREQKYHDNRNGQDRKGGFAGRTWGGKGASGGGGGKTGNDRGNWGKGGDYGKDNKDGKGEKRPWTSDAKQTPKGYGKRDDGVVTGKKEEPKGYGKVRDDGYGKGGKREESKGKGDHKGAGGKAWKGKRW